MHHVYRILVTVSLLTSSWAHAEGALHDAQREVAKAKNRYYREIFSKPKRTGDDEMRLYQQIVVPAETNFTKAFNRTLRDADDKIFGPSRQVLKQRANAGADKQSSSAATTSKPDSGPEKPEVVLDGSNIPKVLEFKGKTAISGSAVETTAPSPIPTPSGGVTELEFQPLKPVKKR